jgi:UDP-N-acetyl-D-mannosaminuronate dehydrogenase
LRIINYLKDKMEVKCCDPFYSDPEIREIAGIEPFTFPDEISTFDAIIISCGHRGFRRVQAAALIDKLKDCRLILDNIGIWSDLEWSKSDNISYRRIGIPGWNR